jgi:hypothetical protein
MISFISFFSSLYTKKIHSIALTMPITAIATQGAKMRVTFRSSLSLIALICLGNSFLKQRAMFPIQRTVAPISANLLMKMEAMKRMEVTIRHFKQKGILDFWSLVHSTKTDSSIPFLAAESTGTHSLQEQPRF